MAATRRTIRENTSDSPHSKNDQKMGNTVSVTPQVDKVKGSKEFQLYIKKEVRSRVFNGESCNICFNKLKKTKVVGIPSCCVHLYCLSCIKQWGESKVTATCPDDRKLFRHIVRVKIVTLCRQDGDEPARGAPAD